MLRSQDTDEIEDGEKYGEPYTKVLETNKQKLFESQALVAHACDPSYSGSRGQVDVSSKPARAE
jgi:hypothetical protein